VAEYMATCFSIYGTERVSELMTMEKTYNFLFLQAHLPTRPANRKKKEEDLNPKGNTRDACNFILWYDTCFCFAENSMLLFCGMFHFLILWNDPFVENNPYPLFSSVTDTTTPFLCTGIRDPYYDEVN
jgi:hypothetical protein